MISKDKQCFPSNRGITLTELLVASIIIGIVMVGAISVDYAIRRSQQNVASASHIAMNLQAAMLQMTKDAALTIGNSTQAGISSDTEDDGDGIYNICFRHDFDNDPNTYDDKWVCYSKNNVTLPEETTPFYQLGRCDNDGSGLDSALGIDDYCGKSGSPGLSHQKLAYLNTADFFSIISSPAGIEYVKFDLKACADPDPGVSENPITNPCYSLTSHVSLPSLSR